MEDSKLLKDANKLFDKEAFSQALPIYLRYSEENKGMLDQSSIADLVLKISQCYLYKDLPDPEKSLEFALQSLKIHESDFLKKAQDLIYIASIEAETEQSKAAESLNNALNIAEELKDHSLISEIYNNLGLLNWSDKGKALEYFLKAKEMSQKNKDLGNYILTLQNLSYLEKENGNKLKAMEYLNEAMSLIDQTAKSLKKTEKKSFKNSYSDLYDSAADLAMEMEDVELAMKIAERAKEY